jgi:hypothetical protein
VFLEANKNDKGLIRKYFLYLPTNLSEILPASIVGPDDAFEPGDDFLLRLAEVASTRVDPPKPSPIHFATTPEALATNDQLLRDHGFDLGSLIEDSQDTTLGYGSEFRPLDQLEKVLGGHPEFKVLEKLVKKDGMGYRFKKEITETERLTELQGMMERGNHKPAEEELEK